MSAPKDDIVVTRVDRDTQGKPIHEATETTSLLSAGASASETSSCEDTWPGYADFADLPWWKTPSVGHHQTLPARAAGWLIIIPSSLVADKRVAPGLLAPPPICPLHPRLWRLPRA